MNVNSVSQTVRGRTKTRVMTIGPVDDDEGRRYNLVSAFVLPTDCSSISDDFPFVQVENNRQRVSFIITRYVIKAPWLREKLTYIRNCY